MNKYVITLHENDDNIFEQKCNELIEQGYKISSTNCDCIVNDTYDCQVYQAIMIKEKLDIIKEKENLYNWNDPKILHWVKYIATDKSGCRYGYEFEPEKKNKEWLLSYGRIISLGIFNVGDWENSLEERPKNKEEFYE
jgi:hypothetical protein